MSSVPLDRTARTEGEGSEPKRRDLEPCCAPVWRLAGARGDRRARKRADGAGQRLHGDTNGNADIDRYTDAGSHADTVPRLYAHGHADSLPHGYADTHPIPDTHDDAHAVWGLYSDANCDGYPDSNADTHR